MYKLTQDFDDVRFAMSVYWPEANVDVVFAELSSFDMVEEADNRTPTASSVDLFIEQAYRDQEIKDLGFSVKESYGLMMGCCSLTFGCSLVTLNNKRKLAKLRLRIKALLDSNVKYYRPSTPVGTSGCFIGVSR